MTYLSLAARQALPLYGKRYADYLERHAAELFIAGHDVYNQSLGECLAGNDGD